MNINYKKLPVINNLIFDECDDIYICALGFENRSVGALRKLVETKYRTNIAIMLKYDIHEEDNEINYEELNTLLSIISNDNFIEIPFKTNDISHFFRDNEGFVQTYNKIINEKEILNVTVDISTFNTALVLLIMDYFLSLNIKRLKIIYTDAQLYFPSKRSLKKEEEQNNLQKDESVSSGINSLLTIPKYGGIYTPGYSNLLIIILGYEITRARGLIQMVQPSRKIGIIGMPSRPDLYWRLDLAKNLYKHLFSGNDEIKPVPEFNFIQVYHQLEELYDKYNYINNISIAPLGSKMQTLAVLLFLKNHPDVQLFITTPTQYDPRRYSEGIGNSYQVIFTE